MKIIDRTKDCSEANWTIFVQCVETSTGNKGQNA